MTLARLVVVSIFVAPLLGCRERPASSIDAAAAKPLLPTPADALTVVVGNDATTKPEELVPEPELEPQAAEGDSKKADVKLILRVQTADAEVFWGAKRLGVAKRGEPFEIVRPQHSGPVDLLLRASGFLPYHTRLFSDRDDRIVVDLVRPTQAPSLNGWRPSEKPEQRKEKPQARPRAR